MTFHWHIIHLWKSRHSKNNRQQQCKYYFFIIPSCLSGLNSIFLKTFYFSAPLAWCWLSNEICPHPLFIFRLEQHRLCLPASIDFKSHAIFRPSVRIVCNPSRSCSTSWGGVAMYHIPVLGWNNRHVIDGKILLSCSNAVVRHPGGNWRLPHPACTQIHHCRNKSIGLTMILWTRKAPHSGQESQKQNRPIYQLYQAQRLTASSFKDGISPSRHTFHMPYILW